jgi:ribosomal subunit interface protein
MKVMVKGVHLKVSRRLRDYVEEHLVVPMTHFIQDEAAELEVHLVDTNGSKGGVDRECRVAVRLPHAKGLHVTEVSDDIHASIALARDRLERLVKREIAKRRRPTAHRISKPAGRLAPQGMPVQAEVTAR